MEKYVPKIKTLFKTGFFHIFGSSVINKVIAFLSSVVLVRILTKPEYGVFTYAWNIYSIVLILNGMGIESGVLQISSEHSGDIEYANRASNYGIRFGIKFDLLLFAVILVLGCLRLSRLRTPVRSYAFCACCRWPNCCFK
jgi:O-antigen/teichoic acid export membrane protein